MLKKIIIYSMSSAVIVVAAVFFSWQLKFLNLPLTIALRDITKQEVSFGQIRYRPFNRVTLTEFTVGSDFRCKKITVYFSPLRLLTSLKNPQQAIRSINFDRPWISITPETASYFNFKRDKSGNKLINDVRITFENGEISGERFSFSKCEGGFNVGSLIEGRVSGKSSENTLNMVLNIDNSASLLKGEIQAKLEGTNIKIDTIVNFTESDNGIINAKIVAPELSWHKLSIVNSNGILSYSKSNISGKIEFDNGYAEVSKTGSGDTKLFGKLNLASLLTDTSGEMEFDCKVNDSLIEGNIDVSKVSYKGIDYGSLKFIFDRQSDGILTGRGIIGQFQYIFGLKLKSLKDLNVFLQAGNKGHGKIHGSIYPLSLEFKFSKWPANLLRLIKFADPSISGTIDLAGQITNESSVIKISEVSLQSSKSYPVSFRGDISLKDRKLSCQLESFKSDLVFSAELDDLKSWGYDIRLDKLSSKNIFSLIKSKNPLNGVFTGNIVYASGKSGKLELSFKKLMYNDDLIGDGNLGIVFENDLLELKKFYLNSGKGTVSGNGFLRKGLKNSQIELNLIFQKFSFKETTLAGLLDFRGKILSSDMFDFSKINGTISSDKFSLNSWTTKQVSADISVNNSKIDLNSLVFKPYLNGNFSVDLKEKLIDGNISLFKVPINMFIPSIDGLLFGRLSINGSVDNPQATLNYSIPKAVYRNTSFENSGTAIYRDESVYLKEVVFSSAKSGVVISGKLWPAINLSGHIDDFSTSLLTQILKSKLPVKGNFSGPIKIIGSNADPEFIFEVNGTDIYLGELLINDIKTHFTAKQREIKFDYLKARFSDSEYHLLTGSNIQILDGKFKLISDLRNIHIGKSDIFGNMEITGDWQKSAIGVQEVNCLFSVSNFWINRYNLKVAKLGFKYSDNTFIFSSKKNQALKISGNIDISDVKDIYFNKFSIMWNGNSYLSIDGNFGENKWEFLVSGNEVSSMALSEILNLPVSTEGNLDVSLAARGSMENPQLEGSLNIANGSVEGIPFDNMNLQFSASQDLVTIERGRLVKKDQYSVNASGFAPFYLTKSSKKRVSNLPLDLTFSVEDGTIEPISGLIKEIKYAKGIIHSQMRITGTLSKPIANGYLRIINGEIGSNRYFNKLSNFKVECIWKNNRLSVEEFSGKIGDGYMSLKGNIFFEGLAVKQYNLLWETTDNKGISITVPELPIPLPLFKSNEWELFSNNSHGDPIFSIRFSGSPENLLLSGWVEMENTHFTYPSLAKKSDIESILNELWPIISWDLELRSGKKTWYDNELVNVNIQGGIKLTGKGAVPDVAGHIESVRGTISYIGTEFKIKQASVEIFNKQVFLEGEAHTEIYGNAPGESDIIEMYIDKSEITKIKPRFVSRNNPDISQEKALARATGIDPEYFSSSDREYLLRQQFIRLFDSTLTTPLARNLLRRSGIADSFRVQYLSQEPIKPENPANPTMSELLYGTKYSLEKYLTDRIFFGYSVTFDQIQQKLDLRHELELSYRWKRNIFFHGSYELKTNNPNRQFDRKITVEQQWRFGWPKKE